MSTHVRLPTGVVRPDGLPALETLNAFGVQATYMPQVRDLLEEVFQESESYIADLLRLARRTGG